jgi:3-hydroxy-9,10-secoandrosta-1,3,5(10)-triene-9,17-dione monooxygenase
MIAMLHDAGALSLTKPRRFGGLELGPHALIRLGYELGQSCGSTAWCASLGNCNAWFAAFWPSEVQNEIWGRDPAALVAGVAVPTGRVERKPGGYGVSGTFPFASNCENSKWIFLSGVVPADGDSPAATAWFLVPSAELVIDQTSWHVSGLQGTGSKTILARDPVFVPAHRALWFDDVSAGTVPGLSDPANRMARFGYPTFGAAALVGPMLGMAKGALDWFAEAMRSKLRVTLKPGAPLPAAASPFVQARIGAAATMIEAALALLAKEFSAAESKIAAGEELSVAERVHIRGSLGFAARQAVSATNMLAEASGGSAADVNVPIQRFWRDVNAAARHVSLDTQGLEALVGQQRLGLPLLGIY